MALILPGKIASAQDLASLEIEIKNYAQWFAHNEIKQRTGAKKGTPAPVLSPAGLELIRTWSGGKMLSQKSLEDLIAALEKSKANSKTITITLAAPAPGNLKASIVTWCRENIAPGILVNFQFNSTLCGGMVVRAGSRVFDHSWRRQILENRSVFSEVLKRV